LGLLSEAFGSELWPIHRGTVWSTDAPFRETVGKVGAYQAAGVLAVDMETSALFAVARFRGIRLASLLVVSDELSSLSWRPGFKDPRFQAIRSRAIHHLLGAVEGLGKSAPSESRKRGPGQ
jgi:uridine phosphorylase